MGIAVLSHRFFDLIVHTPDLPLCRDESVKLGFGLCQNGIATFTLETVFLMIGLWLYLSSTKANSILGEYGMPIFVALLLVVNAQIFLDLPLETVRHHWQYRRLQCTLFLQVLLIGLTGSVPNNPKAQSTTVCYLHQLAQEVSYLKLTILS